MSAAVSALIFIALNALLSLYTWGPTISGWRALIPLPETIVLVWLSLLCATLAQRRIRRVGTIVSGSILGLLLSFSIAETFFQSYFARPFYPRSDISLVRGGLLLLFGDIGRTADLLAPFVVVLILVVASVLGSAMIAGAGAVLRTAPRPALGVAAVTLVAVPLMVIAGMPESLGGKVVAWARPESTEFVAVDVPDAIVTEDEEEAIPEIEYTLPGLMDRDIYFIAMEAYGYTTVSRPELSVQFDPLRQQLQDTLASQGYEVLTNYFQSPVVGGYSWLAEATLFSGQWIDSQEKFEEFAVAGLPTLSGLLHDSGYHTVTVRPGTIHGDWPEGWELYQFDDAIISYDGGFGFEGPWFSFVPVTDQFALWTGYNRVQELVQPGGPGADGPTFVYYQLVSTHTPFTRIPPVIDDWSTLGDGSIYRERSDEIRRFDNSWTGGNELDEGYVAAFEYEFAVVSDYVDRFVDHSRDPIFVFYGDHQPQRPIRPRDALRSTPFHVASRDESVLELFRSHGFQAGMVGTQPAPHPRMDSFFAMFRDIAFGIAGS